MFKKNKNANPHKEESYFDWCLKRKRILAALNAGSIVATGAALASTIILTKRLVDMVPEDNIKKGIILLGGSLMAYESGVIITSSLNLKTNINDCNHLKRIIDNSNKFAEKSSSESTTEPETVTNDTQDFVITYDEEN